MKRFDTINVIPLIDVMLVLLAVVLTTASFIVHDSIELDLPDTKTTEAFSSTDNNIVHLSVNAQGQFFINDTPSTIAQLDARLASMPSNTPMIIKIDERAKFGEFVQLVDVLKAHRFTELTFLTEKATASPVTP